MRITLLALLATSALAFADIAAVPKSVSPDGKIQAVIDLDRDPKIFPEWEGELTRRHLQLPSPTDFTRRARSSP